MWGDHAVGGHLQVVDGVHVELEVVEGGLVVRVPAPGAERTQPTPSEAAVVADRGGPALLGEGPAVGGRPQTIVNV